MERDYCPNTHHTEVNMFTEIVSIRVPESNPQPLDERVANAHRDAAALISWLSIPGVGEKYNLEAAYLITMLKMCMDSTSPGESVNDIDLLVEYIRQAVSS